MSIALRDAPRGGQDGARLDFANYKAKDFNSGAADSQAGAYGHERQRVTERPETCGEVAP